MMLGIIPVGVFPWSSPVFLHANEVSSCILMKCRPEFLINHRLAGVFCIFYLGFLHDQRIFTKDSRSLIETSLKDDLRC